MSNVAVNLEGLNDEQITLVARFAEILRRARGKGQVRADLTKLWGEWSEGALPISDAEAEELSDEAVRYARSPA